MRDNEEQETSLDHRLATDLRRLSETGIEPERDLWPRLEQEIRSSVRRVRHRVWRYAAAAVVLIAMFTGITWRLTQKPSATGFAEIDSSRSLAQLPQASSEEFRATFALYLSERQQVLALIAKQLHDYPPELRDDIRHSIEEIERAMRDIEVSVAQGPSESATETRLTALYKLELRLLGVVNDRLQEAASSGGMS